MRVVAILIVLSLALGIMVPPAFAAISLRNGAPCIGSLDVCHAAAPALASGGEMPCLIEHACGRCTVISATTFGRPEPPFLFGAVLVSIDRPPRA